jgi:hypothetical protein
MYQVPFGVYTVQDTLKRKDESLHSLSDIPVKK